MTEWRRTVSAILDAPGVVVVLGPVDVGKTTVATTLANAAVRAGRRPAIVDADTGQSELGPPTTVGLGMVDRAVRRMMEVPLRAAYFAGDTSPRDVHPFVVEGMVRLVYRAQALGASIVVVDTSGWIEGPAATAAKVQEVCEAAARHVVVVQHGDEVEPILARLPADVIVHRLRPDARARRRSSAERRGFREQQFARYFRNVRTVTLELGRVRQERTITCAGRRIPAARVTTELPLREVRHRLVGLVDDGGGLVALGTVVGLRNDGDALDVLAPRRALGGVHTLQWGMLRVSPAGREQRQARGAA
ncbi:MAG TPA: polynucleotide 5'-hydroxyl-kinase [bacterium]|nr:polynucleotide 5'-hydroxyl-kinase [bacterium]